MNCPVCGDALREIEKFEVRVDICPGCKGVWLDRGELEKVVELASRAVDGAGRVEARGARPVEYPQPPFDRAPRHHSEHQTPYPHKKHKKGHWLGELFEVFD